MAYRGTIVSNDRFNEPGPNGGAYYHVLTYSSGAIRTVEYTRQGGHLVEYDGEPRRLEPAKG